MPKSYLLNHDAFETLAQLNDYVIALQQRMLPLKFAYIGSAAHTHDKLVRSKEYGLADAEAVLIQDNLLDIIMPHGNEQLINIVDIGAGNGLKGLKVLQLIKARGIKIRYSALDYSQELLKIATRNIAQVLSQTTVNTHQVDFETSSFKDIVTQTLKEKGTNLFLLLGNTIGNPADRLQSIRNIRASMDVGDLLLIGFELFHNDRIPEILAHYKNEPFYNAVFNPLTFANIKIEDGNLEVLFNDKTHNVEVFFRLAEDLAIRISENSHLKFTVNESILIFLSHRFTLSEFEEDCSSSGLKIVDTVLNEDSTYSLIIARAV